MQLPAALTVAVPMAAPLTPPAGEAELATRDAKNLKGRASIKGLEKDKKK